MRRLSHLWVPITFLLLAGCSNQQSSPDQVRERAADATAAIKRDAKAIAQGVKEGWSRENPLDLNKATKEQLMALPGITDKNADAIIADRPYGNSSELLTRHILAKQEYDKIADRVTAKK